MRSRWPPGLLGGQLLQDLQRQFLQDLQRPRRPDVQLGTCSRRRRSVQTDAPAAPCPSDSEWPSIDLRGIWKKLPPQS